MRQGAFSIGLLYGAMKTGNCREYLQQNRTPGGSREFKEQCVKILGEILLSNVNVADVPEVNGGCVSVVAQVVFQTCEVIVLCI